MKKFAILLIILTFFISLPSAFGDNTSNEEHIIISVIDDELFSAAMDSTIISTNGSVIGKLQLTNPEKVGQVLILDTKKNQFHTETQIPSWITMIITIVGIGIPAVWAGKQFRRQTDATSADFILRLHERLFDPRIFTVRRMITNAANNPAMILRISNNQDTDPITGIILDIELDEFLDELEVISRFINKKMINPEDAYQIFGTLFLSVFDQTDINNYIQNAQQVQRNWFDQFESAVQKLRTIRDAELST